MVLSNLQFVIDTAVSILHVAYKNFLGRGGDSMFQLHDLAIVYTRA